MLELNRLYNIDCMEGMKQFPDKYFELAIVDPPYGNNDAIGIKNGKSHSANRKNYNLFKNIAPTNEYFEELKRVSKNQIIWGGNYFKLPPPRTIICWEKMVYIPTMSQIELAWTSFTTSVRKFTFRWAGMLQGNMKQKEIRIHPTQKPVALYKWLLKNYAKEGQTILDTHLGSGSSAIAAHD